MAGKYRRHSAPRRLPYPTMTVDEIKALDVVPLAAEGCHLWLWTTNAYLRAGYDVMDAWGFRYLAPIHWIKPSGFGNYVVHRSQTLLLGYRGKCRFDGLRYFPNVMQANPGRHSRKPECFHELIEKVSQGPRLEMFAREKRPGWDAWGDEIQSDLIICSGVLG
jgi:N6-adenosine-specific RNA methylase IME4